PPRPRATGRGSRPRRTHAPRAHLGRGPRTRHRPGRRSHRPRGSGMSSPGTRDHVELRTGVYADSVTLLQVSRQVQQLPGVAAAQVAMATPLNVEVLERMGFVIPGDATVNHLVLAIRLDDGDRLDGGGLDAVRA